MGFTLERGVRSAIFADNLDWRKTNRMRYLLELSDMFKLIESGEVRYVCFRDRNVPIAFIGKQQVGFCYPRPEEGIGENVYKEFHRRLKRFYTEIINN